MSQDTITTLVYWTVAVPWIVGVMIILSWLWEGAGEASRWWIHRDDEPLTAERRAAIRAEIARQYAKLRREP